MPTLNKHDAEALESIGLEPYPKPDYFEYSWPQAEMFAALGITKTVAYRIGFTSGVECQPHGNTFLYCPLFVARRFYRILTKRKQTLQEYTQYILALNRSCSNPKKYGGSKRSNRNGLMPTLHVINKLTANSPKARALFQRELEKIGVYLPPLEPAQQS